MRLSLLVLAPIALAIAGCAGVSVTAPPQSTAASCDAPPSGDTVIAINQVSMEHTLEPGDKILVAPGTPVVNDIVAFQPPASWTSDPVHYVKRVVGVKGDSIEVRDGNVFRNGTRLDEAFASGPTTTMESQARWVVGDDELFVLGDNRPASADSRVFGLVAVDNLIGVATMRCGPTPSPLR